MSLSSPKKKVLCIVNNSVVYDSRVKREATALMEVGYQVTILGRAEEELPIREQRNGIEYIRVPFQYTRLTLKKLIICKKQEGIVRSPLFTKNRLATAFIVLIVIPFLFIPLLLWLGEFLGNKINASWLPKIKEKKIKILNDILKHFLLSSILFEEAACSLIETAYSLQPDIIHAHDLDTLRIAYTVAKALNIPFIYDSHELERDRNDRRSIWNKLEILTEESAYIREAAATITVSESIALSLSHYYKIPKSLVLYNTPLIKKEAHTPINLRHDLRLTGDTPLLVYVGLITIDRGLEHIIAALTFLPNWHFALVGPKKSKLLESLQKQVAHLGLVERVHFMDPVPNEAVVEYIHCADVGIVIASAICKSHIYSLPNKLFEMSFAAIPMVVSDLKAMREYVKEHNLGEIVHEPVTPKHIAEKIKYVYENKDQYSCTQKAIELQAVYGWDAQAKKLVQLYQQVLGAREVEFTPALKSV